MPFSARPRRTVTWERHPMQSHITGVTSKRRRGEQTPGSPAATSTVSKAPTTASPTAISSASGAVASSGRVALALAVAAAVALPPSSARADDAAEAKSLARDAQKFYDKKNYDEACPLFERSLALDPNLKTRGALAICYEEAGKTGSA